MSITFKELQHGHLLSDIDINTQQQMEILLKRINMIRDAWGKPMTVTSGYRTESDQMRINPKAPRSAHTRGQAVDILDEDGSLAAWVHANEALLEQVGLWCEATESTKGWVHFQIVPPRSGHRFFVP